jgi:putative membrane-bound dehydrogenase-like protein
MMRFSRSWVLVAAAILAASATSQGFQDTAFPAVYNSEKANQDSPMAAEEAAKTMELPEGFSATVFASEPDIQNPIAMTWDHKGRLWVAENYTYAERTQRFDLNLRDRVLIFDDTDGDGVSDERHVFTDQVQMLTSVEVGRGGVWLMCPPQLLYLPDADGDDIPDGPAEVVLDGFTVSESNYHNFANGLKWGPDGWLYGRCGHSCPGLIGPPGSPVANRIPIDGGVWRYHPERRIVEVLCHGTVNPWGHDWDENGQLFFINTVIGHLWHVMPGMHFKESSGESMNPGVYQRLDTIADHYHFDTRSNWTASRDGKANHLGGGHAHIGMMIYQDGHWPASYHHRLFTLNMHGRRANVERLERLGAGYVGRHEPDFLISNDPFFRGIEISVGPDRNVYVADWSDTGECHDATGVHRTSGRIFKITYPGSASSSGPLPKPLCLGGKGPLPKIWDAYQQGRLREEELVQLLNQPHEHVRAWAIRLLSDFWPLDTILGPQPTAAYPEAPKIWDQLRKMAEEDRSGIVLLTLASTLQRLPIEQRIRVATALVQRSEFANDRDLPALVWYGLIPVGQQSAIDLAQINASNQWPDITRWSARLIASQVRQQPDAINFLLKVAEQRGQDFQIQVLEGMNDAFRGWRQVTAPARWDRFSKTEGAKSRPELTLRLSQLFGEGWAMDEIRKIALDKSMDVRSRQAALQTLIEAEANDLQAICESLLSTHPLNVTAAQGLAKLDDPKIGQTLINHYQKFHPGDRPAVIEILASRTRFARGLLNQLGDPAAKIPRQDISAFHARQIQALNDPQLNEQLAKVWGDLREIRQERQREIDRWRELLTPEILSAADLELGHGLFRKNCSNCHRLYGEGASVGPDLSGAQRDSLDYLLTNILDPSATVGKDYRMSLIETDDGRVLSGLILAETPELVVLQTSSQKIDIRRDEIEAIHTTALSSMPEGLLKNLSQSDVIHLIGFLMSKR